MGVPHDSGNRRGLIAHPAWWDGGIAGADQGLRCGPVIIFTRSLTSTALSRPTLSWRREDPSPLGAAQAPTCGRREAGCYRWARAGGHSGCGRCSASWLIAVHLEENGLQLPTNNQVVGLKLSTWRFQTVRSGPEATEDSYKCLRELLG